MVTPFSSGERYWLAARRAALSFLAVLSFPFAALAFWPLSEPPPPPEPPPAAQAPLPLTGEIAEFEARIAELAAALGNNLADTDPAVNELDEGVVVCTFVELGRLTRSSSFGRYLADRLMNSLQQSSRRVVEMRKSRAVIIQENHGEHGLSRDPARIMPEVAAGVSLTGTYTETPEHVLVNARLVSNRDAAVLSSAQAVFPRSGAVAHLLADRSSLSGRAERDQVVYMKRLAN